MWNYVIFTKDARGAVRRRMQEEKEKIESEEKEQQQEKKKKKKISFRNNFKRDKTSKDKRTDWESTRQSERTCKNMRDKGRIYSLLIMYNHGVFYTRWPFFNSALLV